MKGGPNDQHGVDLLIGGHDHIYYVSSSFLICLCIDARSAKVRPSGRVFQETGQRRGQRATPACT
jgi:hypothetical protein